MQLKHAFIYYRPILICIGDIILDLRTQYDINAIISADIRPILSIRPIFPILTYDMDDIYTENHLPTPISILRF